ncbi:hypothetical protein CERSUDRAFT_94318 [Gelatoporia subvermispora B]|uniref:FAD-binding PCMH-type domain-containing protein n=1 Tax=Ceriporiopsis subvermispora (strain B) TaxID=914234 RepID=M2QYT9_CERS8|nr:hypothetical protein CERSUDRAFT_94318 [Gelatoporia subvermispora B]
MLSSLKIALLLGSLLTSAGAQAGTPAHLACESIARVISPASDVFYPGDLQYEQDIEHFATNIHQLSACSVEPGTPEDVGAILRILGEARVPFAVKGGGHETNPGFSSTFGVQIAMTRFSEIVLDADAQTVRVGAGVIWDDVYSIVEPQGFNVVGGRQTGVGVAGFSVGGGYSFLTNQFGLSIDNVLVYELVLPNGTIANVTAASNPDLSFALRGIVTTFTLQAYPQSQVWGGSIVLNPGTSDQLTDAVLNFVTNVTDPKASIIPAYNVASGTIIPTALLFYDAPTPPDGIFDDFLAIPAIEQDIATRSMLSLVQTQGNSTGFRSAFNTVPFIQYTPKILDALANETEFWNERLTSQSAAIISWAAEPFLPDILSKHPDIATAYPPTKAQVFSPLSMFIQWNDSTADDTMREALRQSATHLTAVAVEDGQDIRDAPEYGNYAIDGTPLSRIFGEQLPRLKEIKRQYDPQGVMGLTGGWKV